MASYKVRSIMNNAAESATDEVDEYRSEMVGYIEDLRAELGLTTSDIDDLIGESKSWYQNHKGGERSHYFDIRDYYKIEYLLENYPEADLDEATEYAGGRVIERTYELEVLRWTAEIEMDEVSQGIGKEDGGWYRNRVIQADDRSFSVYYFCLVRVFLETIVLLMLREGYLVEEDIDKAIEIGLPEDYRELSMVADDI